MDTLNAEIQGKHYRQSAPSGYARASQYLNEAHDIRDLRRSYGAMLKGNTPAMLINQDLRRM
jgi:hypothetical protein